MYQNNIFSFLKKLFLRSARQNNPKHTSQEQIKNIAEKFLNKHQNLPCNKISFQSSFQRFIFKRTKLIYHGSVLHFINSFY
jgi:hypothetical protein